MLSSKSRRGHPPFRRSVSDPYGHPTDVISAVHCLQSEPRPSSLPRFASGPKSSSRCRKANNVVSAQGPAAPYACTSFQNLTSCPPRTARVSARAASQHALCSASGAREQLSSEFPRRGWSTRDFVAFAPPTGAEPTAGSGTPACHVILAYVRPVQTPPAFSRSLARDPHGATGFHASASFWRTACPK